MQVQKVRSTNSNSFKASFINDDNGYLRRLWENTKKTDALAKQLKIFASKYPEHKLEIIEPLGKNLVGQFKGFRVFNHKTGITQIFMSDSHENLLSNFLYDIFNNGRSNDLFYELQEAKMFQRLTGQKVEPAVKI